MKKNLLLVGFLCFSFFAMSQENRFALSGGYVFANLEETDTDASGWRINALYEFNPGAAKLSHGLAFGYMSTSTDYTSQAQISNYKINSWPVYYAPKVTFGSGSLKGFLKGALGMHISGYKRTGFVEITSTDMGFYGGVGAGGEFHLSDQVFINAEYEWAYMSNSFYRDGFINSVMAGIGFKF
jgi:opacity protein-like surface antigen